jgi:hypothetical protein
MRRIVPAALRGGDRAATVCGRVVERRRADQAAVEIEFKHVSRDLRPETGSTAMP